MYLGCGQVDAQAAPPEPVHLFSAAALKLRAGLLAEVDSEGAEVAAAAFAWSVSRQVHDVGPGVLEPQQQVPIHREAEGFVQA